MATGHLYYTGSETLSTITLGEDEAHWLKRLLAPFAEAHDPNALDIIDAIDGV